MKYVSLQYLKNDFRKMNIQQKVTDYFDNKYNRKININMKESKAIDKDKDEGKTKEPGMGHQFIR